MSRQADVADIETVKNKLRACYTPYKSRIRNYEGYCFGANAQAVLELTRFALDRNVCNLIFEVPYKTPSQTQSFFSLVVEKLKISSWSKPEAVMDFEEMVTAFVSKGVDLSLTHSYACSIPVTAYTRMVKIDASVFFQIMLDAYAFKNTFSALVNNMSDVQFSQVFSEISEMTGNKITLAALSPQFYTKLTIFIEAVVKRNVLLDFAMQQKFKTVLLILCEAAENATQKPVFVENQRQAKLDFPFGKLESLYQSMQLIMADNVYFSDDPLFIACVEKKTFMPWIKDHAALIPWDFFSEIMLQTYSTEKFSQLFIHLAQAGLADHIIKLRQIAIRSSNESWLLFANRLIRLHEMLPTDRPAIRTPLLASVKTEEALYPILLGYHYHSILGRTIIFSNGSDFLAIKVQKKEEPVTALEKEYDAMRLFDKSLAGALTLASDTPKAQGIYVLENLEILNLLKEAVSLEAITALTSLMDEAQSTHCLVYSVASYGYFTYLHDAKISPANFARANENSVRDLVTTLKVGIVFDQLADIFHTHEHKELRTDSGRYLVLVALLRRHHAIHLTHSSGRVDRWQEAIRYVNLRETGLADLGDYSFSQSYYQKGWFQEVNQAYESPEDIISGNFVSYAAADIDFKTVINANVIAEYLFILTLVCGKRALGLIQANDTLSQQERSGVWVTMAEQLINNSALVISLLTIISQANAKHYLRSFVSVDRLAKQMHYWMTPDYAADFKEGKAFYQEKLREIYDPGTNVTFDVTESTSSTKSVQVVEGIGLSVDGVHQDLGAFNAQNPMKEDNKLYYMTPAFISLLRYLALNFRNSFEKFEACLVAQDFKNALHVVDQLKLARYPHSNWQKNCVLFCYARLHIAIFKVQKEKSAHASYDSTHAVRLLSRKIDEVVTPSFAPSSTV